MALQVMKVLHTRTAKSYRIPLLCSDHDMQKDYDEDCVLTSVAEHVILPGKNLETLYCCWMLYQTQAFVLEANASSKNYYW